MERQKIIKKAEELCKTFIDKVESGRARSKETYAACQELLSMIDSIASDEDDAAIAMGAMAAAKDAFNAYVEDVYDIDAAYFRLQLKTEILGSDFLEVLETITWEEQR